MKIKQVEELVGITRKNIRQSTYIPPNILLIIFSISIIAVIKQEIIGFFILNFVLVG